MEGLHGLQEDSNPGGRCTDSIRPYNTDNYSERPFGINIRDDLATLQHAKNSIRNEAQPGVISFNIRGKIEPAVEESDQILSVIRISSSSFSSSGYIPEIHA
ncbi:hypothetical protein DICVIV_06559 [Dictyocaulus viviparus]|uniref:Uncharacterized protein n=1 Tax=Dictyocaulus viviparus TaxID=29172 RepID=A0A0D8XUC3_DICVI|nr:hypothetical protein DICVIV_06559 [Dictyocaulus viviparus]